PIQLPELRVRVDRRTADHRANLDSVAGTNSAQRAIRDGYFDEVRILLGGGPLVCPFRRWLWRKIILLQARPGQVRERGIESECALADVAREVWARVGAKLSVRLFI